MGEPDWPPSVTALEHDLDLLRSRGRPFAAGQPLPTLTHACIDLRFMRPSGGPDLEGLVRSVVADLGDGELCRSAVVLFSLDDSATNATGSASQGVAGPALEIAKLQSRHARNRRVLQAVARRILIRINSQTSPGAATSYKSPFVEWHEKSWVRIGKAQLQEFESDLVFFSRDLVPILTLPEAEQLSDDQVQEVLVLWLYNYLDFTVQLEVGPVNHVCQKIHNASFLDWLPAPSKDDALRIYTDEGGHAEMSNELSRRVQNFTGVKPSRMRPQFLIELDRLHRGRLPIEQEFTTLLFVIVSETLITGTLSKLPIDTTVQPAVRAVALDHATDERRHHAYFAQLLEIIWPRFPKPLRHEAVRLFPKLLHAFLDLDRQSLRDIVSRFPDVFPEPEATIVELSTSAATERAIREAARPSLSQFRKVGVLDEPGAVEIFQSAGFPIKMTP